MSSLEKNLYEELDNQLESGVVERVIKEKFEKCIGEVVESTFRWGAVEKKIKEKIESTMLDYIERTDFKDYVVKLDAVLTGVIKEASVDNAKLLKNFEHLMTPLEVKEIKVSDLFEKWCEYVAKEVETDGLEVIYEDGVSYEPVEVTMEVEYLEKKSWSCFEYAALRFECEHDENLNFEIQLSRWDEKKPWDISYRKGNDLKSLRNLDEFSVYLMRLDQAYCNIEIDTDYEQDEVTPGREPEPSYS